MTSEPIRVPARQGRAIRVEAGGSFRVIDLEGGQVVDLFAFNAGDLTEHASAEHTRVALLRLFPRAGESFVSNRRRPMLTLVEDRSPGRHDMLCAACDPERYATLGVQGWHASCRENLIRAMADLGLTGFVVPQPINLFMNVEVRPDGGLEYRTAISRPGDSVTLRAELDLVVVASACPQDVVEISRNGPTDIALELIG
jgi:uncharacterized protein YcgI (DUF1989 family)